MDRVHGGPASYLKGGDGGLVGLKAAGKEKVSKTKRMSKSMKKTSPRAN